MARYGKGSYSRSSYSGRGRSSGSSSRSYSSAQAHQHVGQTKFGYTKTYSPSAGFKMKKA